VVKKSLQKRESNSRKAAGVDTIEDTHDLAA
jgi:hypothetical protein